VRAKDLTPALFKGTVHPEKKKKHKSFVHDKKAVTKAEYIFVFVWIIHFKKKEKQKGVYIPNCN